MFCRNCGTENDENAKFCRSCGQPIVPVEEMGSYASETEVEKTIDQAEEVVDDVQSEIPPVPPVNNTFSQEVPPVQPQNNTYYDSGATYAQPNSPLEQPVGNSNTTIGALVLGILSIVCCCSCILGLGCGIAAIVMAVNERKKGTATSMTTVALVLGIVGVVLSVIAGIVSFFTGAIQGLSDGTFFDRLRYGRMYNYDTTDYWS